MGYSLHFSIREGILQAVASGVVNPVTAGWIARDIADQASAHAAKAVLIDLRALDDAAETLCTLLLVAGGALRAADCRVAVLHVPRSRAERVLPSLRYFSDAAAAREWLLASGRVRGGRARAALSASDDRKTPSPSGLSPLGRPANTAA